MQFDTTTIAVVSLIVTVLGVVATLVAPKLVGGAWLNSGINSVDRMSRSAPSGEFRVELYHRDKKIDDDLFVVRGHVTNVGSRDIVRAHFVDPIDISTNDPRLEILSLDTSSADGVMPAVENVNGRWKLKWSIIKPKEQISFTAVIRSSEQDLKPRDVEDGIDVIARLVDVKSGNRFSDTFSIPVFLLSFLVMGGLAGTVMYMEGLRPRDAFVISPNSGEFLVPSINGFRTCDKGSGVIYLESCKKTPTSTAVGIIKTSNVEKFVVGVDKISLFAFGPFALLYSALFGFAAARPKFFLKVARWMTISPRLGD